jgi:hypothetical protein
MNRTDIRGYGSPAADHLQTGSETNAATAALYIGFDRELTDFRPEERSLGLAAGHLKHTADLLALQQAALTDQTSVHARK